MRALCSDTRRVLREFLETRRQGKEHGDEPLRAAAREAGACAYVLKENLLELRRLLQSSS